MGSRGKAPEPRATEKVCGTITPPAHLNGRAKGIFIETAQVCAQEGYALTPMDGAVLELYATARADALEHEERIAVEGWVMVAKTSGYAYPNPRVAMRDAALKRAVGAATKLGLAKLDRVRLPKASQFSKDPLSEFIGT